MSGDARDLGARWREPLGAEVGDRVALCRTEARPLCWAQETAEELVASARQVGMAELVGCNAAYRVCNDGVACLQSLIAASDGAKRFAHASFDAVLERDGVGAARGLWSDFGMRARERARRPPGPRR
ncbi:MAG: hypothetical protein WCE62_00380 [Polyangiales bacterium]